MKIVWAIATVLGATSPALGQHIPTTHEVRVDAIVARHPAIEAGGSLILPAGLYGRTTVTVAGGFVDRDSGSNAVGRIEAVSRFLLDPFREEPYGLSVGAGVGVTNFAAASKWKPYLAAVIDLELSQTSGWIPALQLGLGDGARLGIILRSGTGRWR
jgi:hypothetical protein